MAASLNVVQFVTQKNSEEEINYFLSKTYSLITTKQCYAQHQTHECYIIERKNFLYFSDELCRLKYRCI